MRSNPGIYILAREEFEEDLKKGKEKGEKEENKEKRDKTHGKIPL